ncbi:receptor-binding cancer antigen expressed on SiSo cells-like [Uloborus diversus]|uniref:receptor-binding cancer antigen expressed on SiSo cells-like n=1 Tax=Uloborus diversus TaxID=327109 RepID=UPI00240A6180|nr:receptor-binding cancer antigen expressed on SiSo cells-like [Uloborus diversus]
MLVVLLRNQSAAVGENTHEFESHWELWPDSSTSSTPCSSSSLIGSSNRPEQDFEKLTQDDPADDFFKDMVPQIRKPKKIYLKQELRESEGSQMCSNRLALDPKAVMTGPELGIIEDNPSNWEDDETLNESWDPDALIRETKRAEREKRLAEHQRRKLEKESRRSSKQDTSANSLLMSLSDSKDKAKSS